MTALIVHGLDPYNAEPTLGRLRAAYITGARDFYVRCHGDIPRLDESSHRLAVDGFVASPLHLSLAALRELAPATDIHAVLQCAGNRRADLQPVAPTTGDPWAPGAIGHARWTGIPLSRVLHEAGADTARSYVAFEAADQSANGNVRSPFGVSIPMPKALSDDVLLAWAMNGEPLLPEHGHPLRLVVPGYAGVRSPKWLKRITVQDRPSDNHMQARDYRLVPPDVRPDTVDWGQGLVIDEMPINAAICEPTAGAILASGITAIRGYATASGRPIVRVDVSADGGGRWCQARLERGASPWSWTFWDCAIDLASGAHELAVRAWDSAGQTQPSDPVDVWNFKGYLCTAWHRVAVTVS